EGSMKKCVIATAMSICVVSVAAIVSADTLILRDGTRVSGQVVSVAAKVITFEDATGASRRYNVNRVDAIEFSLPSQRNAVGTAGRTPGRTPGNNARLEVLPAGTELTVRTAEDTISST